MNALAGRRSSLVLVGVLLVVLLADRLFALFLFSPCVAFGKTAFGTDLSDPAAFAIVVLPDLWLALIGLILGTLLLVVSIASQTIPRLIDIYLGNFYSIVFIWYLVVGTGHSLIVHVLGPVPAAQASKLFNLDVLLPLGVALAFPYTHYILKRSKPEDIIQHIFEQLLKTIHELAQPERQPLLNHKGVVARYQGRLFESLNQLDDMLSYIAFKGPRAAIITRLGRALREYLRVKDTLNPAFFVLTPAAINDISFLTISTQVATVQETGTVFEQKVLRLLRNAYSRMIVLAEYDLASLCAKELSDTGSDILRQESGDPARRQATLDFFIVWFNTFMRVGIKDVERTHDVRNLFNLLLYYGRFLENLVESGRQETVAQVFQFLEMYGAELCQKSRRQPSLGFPVDVIVAELGRALRMIAERRWEAATQQALLRVLMRLDRHRSLEEAEGSAEHSRSLGVRVIQAGLALFYLRREDAAAVDIIVEDLQEDYTALGRERFGRMLELICTRLSQTEREFWEDTDRGNESLYFTPDKDMIEPFRALVVRRMLSARASS